MQTMNESNVILKRTFHAVGQGAFYTEEFSGNNCHLTIVYDCGSSTDEQILRDRIDETFSENKTIDALFISHFHADHINGIKHLLEHCIVKKIFLPVLDSVAREIMRISCLIDGSSKESFAFQFVKDPAGTVKNIVGSKSGGNPPADEPEIIGVEETAADGNESLISIKGNINSGTNITVDNATAEWVYIPFNFREESRYNKLEKYIADKCPELDFAKIIENWDEYKEKLQDIYDHIPGDLNTNSLVIYSGPRKDVLMEKKERIACLFTGDYNLKGRQKWDAFERAYGDYFKKIFVLQVPHHGSKYNFNVKLLQTQIPCFVISAGTKNKFGHPDPDVRECLSQKSKALFLVDENPDTCFFCIFLPESHCSVYCSANGDDIRELIGI
jgi:beta-lactamase superfamily II metal-dependent hydrolase